VSQVNLLPPEIRQQERTRRLTLIVIGAGVVALALIGLFYFVQTMRLAGAEDELAVQQATNELLQQQIAELQPYSDLQTQLQAQKQLLATVYANEVAWSGVLLDISRIIPDEAYLSSFSGQVAASSETIGTPAEQPTSLIGSLSFQGTADGTQTISSWLNRLEQVKGWVNAWVNSAQETAAFSRIYTFDSGVDLTPEATTPRAQGKVST